jgi:hypothetical protein
VIPGSSWNLPAIDRAASCTSVALFSLMSQIRPREWTDWSSGNIPELLPAGRPCPRPLKLGDPATKLEQANINERILFFPDLDGLSRWLARF